MMDSSPPRPAAAAAAISNSSSASASASAQEPGLPPAGTKRPAPSLLPPFEPLSSSPGFPRPAKRQARAGSVGNSHGAHLKYPTPVPTSSTGLLSSSPPRIGGSQHHLHHQQQQDRQLQEHLQEQEHQNQDLQQPSQAPQRHGLSRAASTVSERAPLASVPSVELNENGEPLLMGRSSNSSHYQLSGNRLVSRVHVEARYVPASTPLAPNKIEIVCNGWNGLKLHSQGRTWELLKGDSFTSETEGAEIMVDVQDARLMVLWPRRGSVAAVKSKAEGLGLGSGMGMGIGALSESPSSSSWDDSPPRPRSQARPVVGAAALGARRGSLSGGLQSSPPRRNARIATPESPTPGTGSHRLPSSLPGGDSGEIRIFEDPSADEDEQLPAAGDNDVAGAGRSFATEVLANSFSSDLSDPEEYDEYDENEDPDEENDPIVHSFGPFGANLSDRLASITASSPKYAPASPSKRPRPSSGQETAERDAKPGKNSSSSTSRAVSPAALKDQTAPEHAQPQEKPELEIDVSHVDIPAVRNHVVNQLAFSRLSSTPLSTILTNLPAEEKKRGLTRDQLRVVIEQEPAAGANCIGIIARQGKDAAGKALESEYYYVPEADDDETRRLAVTDGLRKPSLRACRKQHKQYYWKRPKTP